VDSGGKTLVAPITDQGTAVYAWEADAAWYDPGAHRADFVIATENPGGPLAGIAVSAGQEFFGRPAHTYSVDGYVIMVYRYNLLTRLADRAFPVDTCCQPAAPRDDLRLASATAPR
jgi:hypothetical protein